MSQDSWRIISGIAVLMLGVAAGLAVGQSVGPDKVLPPPEATPATQTTAARPVHLPGVPDSITRVLAWSGNTGFADPATNAQLPPAVVDALVANGVPLAIPSDTP